MTTGMTRMKRPQQVLQATGAQRASAGRQVPSGDNVALFTRVESDSSIKDTHECPRQVCVLPRLLRTQIPMVKPHGRWRAVRSPASRRTRGVHSPSQQHPEAAAAPVFPARSPVQEQARSGPGLGFWSRCLEETPRVCGPRRPCRKRAARDASGHVSWRH